MKILLDKKTPKKRLLGEDSNFLKLATVIQSDEGLTFETSALETLYSGQVTINSVYETNF